MHRQSNRIEVNLVAINCSNTKLTSSTDFFKSSTNSSLKMTFKTTTVHWRFQQASSNKGQISPARTYWFSQFKITHLLTFTLDASLIILNVKINKLIVRTARSNRTERKTHIRAACTRRTQVQRSQSERLTHSSIHARQESNRNAFNFMLSKVKSETMC